MTFTVLAHSAETGETGFGITTASISCGGHLPTHTLDGDIVISQAFTRPEDGLVAAREVGAGGDWPAVLRAVDASDPFMRYRQLGAVLANGECHGFTGAECRGFAGHKVEHNAAGDSVLVLGNGLHSEAVLDAMLTTCLTTNEGLPLAERLLRSLEAGRDAGGQASAAGHMAERSGKLYTQGGPTVKFPATTVLDLQVDVHATAVSELRRLYTCCKGILPYNVLRSNDPPATPSWQDWEAAHPEVAAALPPLYTPPPKL
jgi:uncharacterized Ntn-hydrolase superfamily protein